MATLLQRLAGPSAGEPPPSATAAGAPPAELKALRDFCRQRAWLDAERRLLQSAAALPVQAGPLHSHRLVHRALARLRELSPAYFERFMAHADALLWLEQLVGDAPAAGPDVVLNGPAAEPSATAQPRRRRRGG